MNILNKIVDRLREDMKKIRQQQESIDNRKQIHIDKAEFALNMSHKCKCGASDFKIFVDPNTDDIQFISCMICGTKL